VRAAAPASLSRPTRKARGPLAEETRTKQSAAATGRVHSDAARQLLSEAHTGKKKTYAERPRARGQVRSDEVCVCVFVPLVVCPHNHVCCVLHSAARSRNADCVPVALWLFMHPTDTATDK
jgi:NUMOD3 motif